MAKFLKSIFTSSSEKKKSREIDLDEDRDFTPPLDRRRKLSISRSGRMKQNNKKRHELNLELYGEETRPTEKPKHVEYHVNKKTAERGISVGTFSTIPESRRPSMDLEKHNVQNEITIDQDTSIDHETSTDRHGERRIELKVKTPEEEIDSAFEIIDKDL